MEFDISYTSKEITPWGGMVFLKQMLQKTGFRELIDQNNDLPQSGSNRGYKTSTLGQDTYKRFFSKFTQAKNHNISQYFYSWIFDNFKFENFTLDIDSSVMTRYGVQQGAKKGYNPAKRGRPSHHPLIAFIADVKLVANMWLRSGDTSSANNFLGFLEDTLSKLKNKTVSLIRLDSGFFQSNILDYLEF